MLLQHDRAPLWENIRDFRQRLVAPLYCPGHKGGRTLPPELGEQWGGYDLNNLPDTDTLHCPTGSIRQAEELVADAYGVARSFMLVGGSSLGNMAAVMATVAPGDTILVQRNSHKSVVAGIIHSGAIPHWIVPTWDSRFGISHGPSTAAVHQALDQNPQARALVALNPTYFGTVPDVTTIARLCHERRVVFIADEAHGPHFRFGQQYPVAAENAGADLVVQSTHKILSGLSQAAVLHVCSPHIDAAKVQATLQSLQTTSPNFAILASIDLARRQMMQEGPGRLSALRELAIDTRQELAAMPGLACMGPQHSLGHGSGFHALDETKLLIDTRPSGWTGGDAQRFLNREFGVQPELSGSGYLLCILTVGTLRRDLDQLLTGLRAMLVTSPPSSEDLGALNELAGRVAESLPEMVMSPREAFYRRQCAIPFDQAVGRISGEIITPYPPGIPVIVPGERLDQDRLELLVAVKRAHSPISAVDPSLATLRVLE
ncbi:MAG: aminotransferase class I/II-fold pyridoxal phosphate-dependent enzyme [Pirellulaceae bacterium]|nr:aminotransferase class I/II-fold pyridoxal phosphate-dependent enzyme [Pirellulaceae bacterium]